MNDELQRPLQDLADALHHAIETSPAVAEALAALRASGFGAALLLDVTVALSREEAATTSVELAWVDDHAFPVAPGDADFLRSLRIRID